MTSEGIKEKGILGGFGPSVSKTKKVRIADCAWSSHHRKAIVGSRAFVTVKWSDGVGVGDGAFNSG